MAMATDNTCYERAKARKQRTFTLVEQDVLTPEVIGEWIKLGIARGVPRAKLIIALNEACDIRDDGLIKKVPD